MDFLFKEDRVDFRSEMVASREVFLSYPKHVKLTLFMDEDKFEKIRKLEFMQRYMVIDEIREAGNELLYKGEYEKAIYVYVQAYSCLRWLEYEEKQPEPDSDKEDERNHSTEPDDQSLASRLEKIERLADEAVGIPEDQRQKMKVDLLSITQKSHLTQSHMKPGAAASSDPKMKKMFAIFDDVNTVLKMDEQLSGNDLDMRNGLFFNILVNLGVAYMMNLNFPEALQVLEEACSYNSKSSILYFRWSQCISYDELATLQQLEDSKELIRKCFECYAKENVFKNQTPAILKMLNLHNAAEAFEYQRNFIDSQIRHKTQEEFALIKGSLVTQIRASRFGQRPMRNRGGIGVRRQAPIRATDSISTLFHS